MNEHHATEIAFKNGYKKAVMEIFEDFERYFVTGNTYYGHCIHTIGVTTFADLKKKYTGEVML